MSNLIELAKNGDIKGVKLLLSNNVDINIQDNLNIQDEKGATALGWALLNQNIEIAIFLLKNGNIDTNIQNNENNTVLHQESSAGNTVTVKLLLKYGANLNNKTIFGDTALMLSSFKGHTKTVELLLKYGAKLNNKTRYSCAALDVAKNESIKKLILYYINNPIRPLRSLTIITIHRDKIPHKHIPPALLYL